MKIESPYKWIILKIESNGKTFYKVFASWYGGYLGSNSWKMNSGITKIEEDEKYFKFYGMSGSCYQCIKGTYGAHYYGYNVLKSTIKSAEALNVKMTIMPEDTNWVKLINKNNNNT